MHTRLYILLIIASGLFFGATKVAYPEQSFACPLGEMLTFSIPVPPPTAVAASIHISRGVGDISFDPMATTCQWRPAQPGEYRVSIVYELQGGIEVYARTVYCDVEINSDTNSITIINPPHGVSDVSPLPYSPPIADMTPQEQPDYTYSQGSAAPLLYPQGFYVQPPPITQYTSPSTWSPAYNPPHYLGRINAHREFRAERREPITRPRPLATAPRPRRDSASFERLAP